MPVIFDDSDDVILLDNANTWGFDSSSSITVGILARTPTVASATSYRLFRWIKATGGTAFRFGIESGFGDGIYGAGYEGASSANKTISSGVAIDDNEFHWFFVRTNGSNIALFLDGVLKATANDLDQSHTFNPSSDPITLGAGASDGNRAWPDCICACAFWDSPLTDEEIEKISLSKVKGSVYQYAKNNRLAYFPLDDVPHGQSCDGSDFVNQFNKDKSATGDDGANNSGLTAQAEQLLSYDDFVKAVGIATVAGSVSATATPSLATATVLLNAPTVIISKSATASPSIATATVLLNTVTTVTATHATATPSTAISTVLINAPTVVISKSAIATPVIGLVTVLVKDPTVSTSATASAIATPTVATARIVINTPTIVSGGSVSVTATIATASVVINSPTVKISKSAIAVPGVGTITVVANSPTIRIAKSATATVSIAVVTITMLDPTVVTAIASGITVRLVLKSQIKPCILQESQVKNRLVENSQIENNIILESKL